MVYNALLLVNDAVPVGRVSAVVPVMGKSFRSVMRLTSERPVCAFSMSWSSDRRRTRIFSDMAYSDAPSPASLTFIPDATFLSSLPSVVSCLLS